MSFKDKLTNIVKSVFDSPDQNEYNFTLSSPYENDNNSVRMTPEELDKNEEKDASKAETGVDSKQPEC